MNSRKITIEPVTRIEGHGRVTIHLDDDGRVARTFFHVDEFRGFEKFCEGRPFFEMPHITPRICGICPVSHHLAAAKACDALAGVEPPLPARLLRELMHMGQFIQSHSMHFFHLAAPDLLLGFDAAPKQRNVFGIVQKNPDLALKAVNLRRYGQQIIEILGGRRIHPQFAVPGGVNAPLALTSRDKIAAERETMAGYAGEAIKIAKEWLFANKSLADAFEVFPTSYMGMVDEKDGLALYDGRIAVRDPQGNLRATFMPAEYLQHIGEHVENWSYLKFPYLLDPGWPDGVYRVGPLGRLNTASRIRTPMAAAEFAGFQKLNGGKPVQGSIYYHYARLIELLFALERVGELLDMPEILSRDIRAETQKPLNQTGIGVVEAPRGTLFHDYAVDENGLLTRVNLIVATGNNYFAMNKAVECVAKAFVNGNALKEGDLNRVEAAIRCYDPCLSCSTHAMGQMTLVLELAGPDGNIISRIARS